MSDGPSYDPAPAPTPGTAPARAPHAMRSGSMRGDAAGRALLLSLVRAIRGGRLTVRDRAATVTAGPESVTGGLEATVTVHSPSAYRALLRGSRGFAESYADGLWDADDLVALIRILARSLATLDPWRNRIAGLTDPARRLASATRANTRARSRRNIERHYDLSNEFFALVLDETMGYSCAFYEHADMAPVDASRANLDRVCRLLDLRPGDRLLEMGSGWGGLALHAARHHGAHVSTVTISGNQRDYIERQALKAGVADRVEVLMTDYRDVRGTWDKLVSLEMVESVGPHHLSTFVAQCGRLLRPDGLMVMQAITATERLFRIDRYRRTFLNQMIFAGGFTPSLEAVLEAAGRTTALRTVAVYDITEHYPPTLRAWRERLQRNWPAIERLGGFDEHFRRLWTLYFAYCEAGFLERRVQDRQIILAGPDWRGENRLLDVASTPAMAAAPG